MSLFIKFYFTSYMLNMFRTLINPSSGACDTLVVCSCFDVCWSFGVAGWGGIRVAGWNSASACHTDTTPTQPHRNSWSTVSACHTDTTPTQPHRNSNTHRNKNKQPMWWYNRKVAAPDDGCINVRNMLSMEEVIKLNKYWHQVGHLLFN